MSAASRILLSIVAIVVAAGAIAAWVIRGPGPIDFAGSQTVALADYKGANPTGVPASLAKASLVERGAYLARAADCMACHTKPGGKDFAGGLGFKLPFGTLYSTNITPDKESGIGETGANAGPPALRNAIYAATGVALRRLPIDRALIAAGRKS